MRLGYTVGWLSRESFSVLKHLCDNDFKPDFIVFSLYTPITTLPKYNPIKRYFIYLINVKHWLIKFSPRRIVFLMFFWKELVYCKKNGIKIHFVKNINSRKYTNIIQHESPEAVIVMNCGIIKPHIISQFPNTFINAHAGKFPEYRGMNNVEWASFEGKEVIGTIHFIDNGIDTGDIIFEEVIDIPDNVYTINQIRKHAFNKAWRMFPDALRRIYYEKGFKPMEQLRNNNVKYEMHCFLKSIVAIKLKS